MNIFLWGKKEKKQEDKLPEEAIAGRQLKEKGVIIRMYQFLCGNLGENDHRVSGKIARAVRAANTILGNFNYPYVGCLNDTRRHEASWKD